MTQQIAHIIRLADTFGDHHCITHWAVSMRLVKKGNFIQRLKEGGDTHTKTAAKAIEYFHKNWPPDLEWPPDVPRPVPSEGAA